MRAKRCSRAGRQRDHPVSQQNGLIHIIGNENDGLLLGLGNLRELILQLGAGERVERRKWFVEQQDFRLHGQRARHGNALAHAAGQFGRATVCGVAQPNHLDIMAAQRELFGARLGFVYGIDRQVDIAGHAEPGHQ